MGPLYCLCREVIMSGTSIIAKISMSLDSVCIDDYILIHGPMFDNYV